MAKYYKTYFLFYGGLHFFASLAFWLIPDLTRLFLKTPLAPDAAALMGFASALAGLGFIGVAFVTTSPHQTRHFTLILELYHAFASQKPNVLFNACFPSATGKANA